MFVTMLEPALARRLRRSQIQVQAPDGDTVLLQNVPADRRFFNKPHTNLLLKRPRQGMPYLICVDEDLEYTGRDRSLARIFGGAHRQHGWRVLLVENKPPDDIQKVIEDALAVLGFDKSEPGAPSARSTAGGSVLTGFGADLSRATGEDRTETIGRDEEIERVTACVLGWQTRLAVIGGAPGVGKTNLLHAVAAKLKAYRPSLRLVSVDLGVLFAGTLFESEREGVLTTLVKEAAAAPGTAVGMEHLELAVLGTPRGAFLLSEALDCGVGLIGTTLPAFTDKLTVAPLARRLDVIELPEMDPLAASAVLARLARKIAAHYHIRIEESVPSEVVKRSLTLAGNLPAKAIALLDAAAGRAAYTGAGEVGLYHVYLAGTLFPEAERR